MRTLDIAERLLDDGYYPPTIGARVRLVGRGFIAREATRIYWVAG